MRGGSCRCLLILLSLLWSSGCAEARAATGDRTLVLPFRSIGVSDTTVAVVCDLLAGELESRGIDVARAQSIVPPLPSGPETCDNAECAANLARANGAGQVVYGTMSHLGDKIIVRVHALRAGAERPYYTDQLTAMTPEDLDRVMRRVAEGIAAGRPNSERATVGSVTEEETRTPRLRSSRRGLGIRAGFIYPDGNSYGGADRLTSLRITFKYEGSNHLFETTTLTGLAWGSDNVDWTIFDLFGARILDKGDFAPYIGGGLGIHAVHVERPSVRYGQDYEYDYRDSDNATTLVADAGLGFLALRTYDFEIVVDLRYHYVMDKFSGAGGEGAHGILLSFGTSR